MKYEIVAFYKQEIEEIRECAENIGRLYGWRYRCEKIPGSGKLLSACMGEDSVLCLLKRKSYSFYRLIAAMVRNNLAFMERILKHSEARYEVVNEEKSFEKSLIKVLQDLSPGITLMMRPFRLFPFYYPYTVRLYRKHARSEVLIIPRDDSLYIPCH